MDKREYTKQVLQREMELSETVESRLSETYDRIRSGGQTMKRKKRQNWSKIAVAAAMAVAIGGIGMGTSFAVNGVPKGIQEIFGNQYNKNIEKHTIKVDTGKGYEIEVDMPAVEYVPVDEIMANRLLAGYVSEEPVIVQVGEHTVTLESYVTDGQAFCAYMLLERAGGVTAFEGNQLMNEEQGMSQTEESDFFLHFISEDEDYAHTKMYLDLERSTKEKYYVAVHGNWWIETETPVIKIDRYPCTLKELWESEEYIEPEERRISLPETKLLNTNVIQKDGENVVSISPISMKINLDYVYDEPDDYSGYIKYIEIVYKDGSSYVVRDYGELENIGTCCCYGEKDMSASTLSEDALMRNFFSLTFNRIVDVEQISQIKIDDKCIDVQEK